MYNATKDAVDAYDQEVRYYTCAIRTIDGICSNPAIKGTKLKVIPRDRINNCGNTAEMGSVVCGNTTVITIIIA